MERPLDRRLCLLGLLLLTIPASAAQLRAGGLLQTIKSQVDREIARLESNPLASPPQREVFVRELIAELRARGTLRGPSCPELEELVGWLTYGEIKQSQAAGASRLRCLWYPSAPDLGATLFPAELLVVPQTREGKPPVYELTFTLLPQSEFLRYPDYKEPRKGGPPVWPRDPDLTEALSRRLPDDDPLFVWEDADRFVFGTAVQHLAETGHLPLAGLIFYGAVRSHCNAEYGTGAFSVMLCMEDVAAKVDELARSGASEPAGLLDDILDWFLGRRRPYGECVLNCIDRLLRDPGSRELSTEVEGEIEVGPGPVKIRIKVKTSGNAMAEFLRCVRDCFVPPGQPVPKWP
jgi:hypothetical protein